MACACYQKSVVSTLNTTAQPVAAAGTVLNLLGTTYIHTGTSITPNMNSVELNSTGLYEVYADVTFTATGAGTYTIQLNNNDTVIPTSVSSKTVSASTTYTEHVHTIIRAACCPVIKPRITVSASGVEGNVTAISLTAVKIAS